MISSRHATSSRSMRTRLSPSGFSCAAVVMTPSPVRTVSDYCPARTWRNSSCLTRAAERTHRASCGEPWPRGRWSRAGGFRHGRLGHGTQASVYGRVLPLIWPWLSVTGPTEDMPCVQAGVSAVAVVTTITAMTTASETSRSSLVSVGTGLCCSAGPLGQERRSRSEGYEFSCRSRYSLLSSPPAKCYRLRRSAPATRRRARRVTSNRVGFGSVARKT
jgi:hypothetical protein